MVASLLQMANLDRAVPDYTTLSLWQKTLAVRIPYRRAAGPLNRLVDIGPVNATGSGEPARGIKFLGGEAGPWPRSGRASPPNEWPIAGKTIPPDHFLIRLIRKHRVQGRRQSLPGRRMHAFADRGRKVHLAMGTATSDIRAVEFTPGSDGDIEPANPTGSGAPARVLPELLDQIPEDEEIAKVTADGAYDTRRCHCAIIARQASAIIPIRKNGRPWKEDCPAALGMVLGPVADHPSPRNETLRATRHYGRAFWKRWTGYHIRSRIEARMPSQVSLEPVALTGSTSRPSASASPPETPTARSPKSGSPASTAPNALGTADIIRVA